MCQPNIVLNFAEQIANKMLLKMRTARVILAHPVNGKCVFMIMCIYILYSVHTNKKKRSKNCFFSHTHRPKPLKPSIERNWRRIYTSLNASSAFTTQQQQQQQQLSVSFAHSRDSTVVFPITSTIMLGHQH